MIVIIFYVLLRIVRSIVLTTTVLSAILATAFQEPLATLSQVSLFLFNKPFENNYLSYFEKVTDMG
jgi:hypothetical protein